MVGRKLKIGETFADIVDNSQALVDLTIDQSDIGLVAAGQKARVKLDGFPAHTFDGEVVVISPLGQIEGDSSIFYARISVPNSADDALGNAGPRQNINRLASRGKSFLSSARYVDVVETVELVWMVIS